MKKISLIGVIISLLICLIGCAHTDNTQILATTKPVYQFTAALCKDIPLEVDLLVSENVSCLHDYTLQVSQMRKLEQAEVVIINGAGFEDFLDDAIPDGKKIVDCSNGISLHCGTHHHEDGHAHDSDPHIWLSIQNAQKMVENIYAELCELYPQHTNIFTDNLEELYCAFSALEGEAKSLTTLSNREIITFHDGFSYLADSFGLHIVKAIEEESGSEASAREIIEIIEIIDQYKIPAIFIEASGSASAATVIQAETNVKVYDLDMGLSQRNYFEAMHHNIEVLKEALE